jgi:hypothetical protein
VTCELVDGQIVAGFETHEHVWPLSPAFGVRRCFVNGLVCPVRKESKDTCKPNTVTDPRVALSIFYANLENGTT